MSAVASFEAVAPFSASEITRYCDERCPDLVPRGKELRGGCPVHGGKDPNFSMDPETGLCRCFSACDRGWDLIGLEQELTGVGFKEARDSVYRIVGRPLPTNEVRKKKPAPKKIVGKWIEEARYPYTNEAGVLLFEVVRFRKPDGKKAFVQCRPTAVEEAGTTDPGFLAGVEAGGTVMGLDAGMYIPDFNKSERAGRTVLVPSKHSLDGYHFEFRACPRVPYRLPKVLAASTVYLVEGEKDVHTLEEWGLTATCNPGGAGAGWRPEYTQHFRGRHCIFLPDNDKPGRKHAVRVAEQLLPHVASLKIIELPVGEKGDVTDWAEAGGTADKLQELVQTAEPLNAESFDKLRQRWGLSGDLGSAFGTEWPEPEPLLGSLPEVALFDPDLLPEKLRAWVMDIAERLQVPPDFPAATAIVELAAAIGRRARVFPKRHDNWEVVPNLWGGIVGRPGLMKTPTIEAVLKPLRTIEAKALEQHKLSMREFDREMEEFDILKTAWKQRSMQAAKRGSDVEKFEDEPPVRPVQTRFVLNDATLEKAHVILQENPQGILYLRDELAGWFGSLDTVGRERDRPFFLEAWAGTSGFVIDRIGRGSVFVPHLCISIFGALQPSKLQAYLVDAVSGGLGDDGLAQRLQVLVWPDPSPEWEDIDRVPNSAAAEAVFDVFQKIVTISPAEPLRLRFEDDSQELFRAWRHELEGRLRSKELSPAMESHLAKYRSLMPSLAVILHLADGSTHERIPLIHAQRAADWCTYLESHARRAYSCVSSGTHKVSFGLAEKIQAGVLGTRFKLRDVYRCGWSGLDTAELARNALEHLEEAGWVRKLSTNSGGRRGRPTECYEVNPEVLRG